jgi:hypothetical protein
VQICSFLNFSGLGKKYCKQQKFSRAACVLIILENFGMKLFSCLRWEDVSGEVILSDFHSLFFLLSSFIVSHFLNILLD